jgi:hypothetical protein
MPRRVALEDLIDAHDVARVLGLSHRNTTYAAAGAGPRPRPAKPLATARGRALARSPGGAREDASKARRQRRSEKALCRTRTDGPFLTMEGRRACLSAIAPLIAPFRGSIAAPVGRRPVLVSFSTSGVTGGPPMRSSSASRNSAANSSPARPARPTSWLTSAAAPPAPRRNSWRVRRVAKLTRPWSSIAMSGGSPRSRLTLWSLLDNSSFHLV